MLHFLAGLPITVLGLCLAVGFFLSSKRIWKGRLNATIVTILTAFALNLLLQSAGERLNIPDMLPSLFFALFSFAIGFGAGPSLSAGSSKGEIPKQLLLSALYLALAFTSALGLGKLLGLESASAVGMLAGAQTQSSIVALDGVPAQQEGAKLLTYALCYIVGTLAMILFTSQAAPRYLLRRDALDGTDCKTARSPKSAPLKAIVAAHFQNLAAQEPTQDDASREYEDVSPIQLRAYRVHKSAHFAGHSVDEAERLGFDGGAPSEKAPRKLEILAIFREQDGKETLAFPSYDSQKNQLNMNGDCVIEPGDVILVSGKLRHIHDRQDDGLEEEYDDKYLPAQLVSADVLLTQHPDAAKENPYPRTDLDHAVRELLSRHGAVLGYIVRDGKRISPTEKIGMNDILHLTGVSFSINGARQNLLAPLIKKLGYAVEGGADSRLWGMMLMVALAALISSLLAKTIFRLGTGCVSMLLGLILGRLREKHRHSWFYNATYVSPGGLGLVRTLGLNLFVACKTLSAPMELSLFNGQLALAAICSLLAALIPLTLCLILGKRWLKMKNVTLLSSLCGVGTCSSALQTLNDGSDSSEFSAPYAIPYALGDFFLTLLGVLFISIF